MSGLPFDEQTSVTSHFAKQKQCLFVVIDLQSRLYPPGIPERPALGSEQVSS
jgi:hypothetical protein